ncbi:MAG TPA: hypothetical protein PLC59_06470 [Bacteroidales bacterium]|jgi:hypothetical protein|nr:hypothetical protein [Bacteroidales bacterium]
MKKILYLLLTIFIFLIGSICAHSQTISIPTSEPIFYDPFHNGYYTPWTFYQGSHLFTTGVLRLTANKNTGAYAYVRTNWTNITVSADIKLNEDSWAAAIGLRYNPTNGSHYQARIYNNGKFSIEKYINWYNIWFELATTNISIPGTSTNNIQLAITNNILIAFFNGIQYLTYTDPVSLNPGGICLSIWGNTSSSTAEFDNVTVYDLGGEPILKESPEFITGLTNIIGIRNSNALLSVKTTGTSLTYIWQTPNGIVVNTNNTYLITNIQRAGSIGVTISNSNGKVTSSAYMSMGTTNILYECFPAIPKTNILLTWCPSLSPEVTGYYVYYGSRTTPISDWMPDVYDINEPPCPGILLQRGTNWYRNYTNRIDAGNNLSTVISNLTPGLTYYFSVTAYDTNLFESDFLTETSYTVPNFVKPNPSTNVMLTIVAIGGGQIKLQGKVCPSSLTTFLYQNGILQPWNVLASNVLSDVYGNLVYIDKPTNSMRFYRALLQ